MRSEPAPDLLCAEASKHLMNRSSLIRCRFRLGDPDAEDQGIPETKHERPLINDTERRPESPGMLVVAAQSVAGGIGVRVNDNRMRLEYGLIPRFESTHGPIGVLGKFHFAEWDLLPNRATNRCACICKVYVSSPICFVIAPIIDHIYSSWRMLTRQFPLIFNQESGNRITVWARTMGTVDAGDKHVFIHRLKQTLEPISISGRRILS